MKRIKKIINAKFDSSLGYSTVGIGLSIKSDSNQPGIPIPRTASEQQKRIPSEESEVSNSKRVVTKRRTLPNGKEIIVFTNPPREFEPRFAGVNIPLSVNVCDGLCMVYGISSYRAKNLLKEAAVDPRTRAGQVSPKQLRRIRSAGRSADYPVESSLRRRQRKNIKRMKRLGTAKGRRHRVLLPVRGQRTKCNARTRKEQRS